MAVELTLRKWGNSLGVVLPKELVKQQKLKPNQTIYVQVIKPANLRPIFGTLPDKMSGQAFKNLVKKGWY